MKIPFTKNPVKVETIDRRNFTYSKNGIQLTFVLRIDTKQELKDFKDLLLKATEDVDKEINK